MQNFRSKVNTKDDRFLRNKEEMQVLVDQLHTHLAVAKKEGSDASIERARKRKKFLARERIQLLLDKDSPFIELMPLAGMLHQGGFGPGGTTVASIGYVNKRLCIVNANLSARKAGAVDYATSLKIKRLGDIAMENKIPIIYLVDSAGIFLPLQDQIFADKDDFGRIFRNNAKMSSMGIVQIAAIMGSCVAGGAYLPIMSDEAIIVEKTGSIFLAGSYLVKAAIGEEVDNELLGGADTHSGISGVTDYKVKNDEAALNKIRSLIEKMGSRPLAGFKQSEIKSPKLNTKSLYGLLPKNRSQPYDTYSLLDHIVDEGSMDEYKKEYGQTLITSYAKIEGWSVGVIVNQRKIVKSKTGEMQFGGVIYGDAADKATRFIANCNQRNIPLVFLQDVTGFMVGSNAEHGGIIKDGAKMVNAVANSIVPKFTIIVGNSFGAGNYAMCGKAYDPRFMLAWPTAKLAVMGGSQAANVLLQIEKVTAEKSGNSLNAKKEKELRESIQSNYDEKTEILHAASQLWVDAVIKPEETRSWISMGIDIANHAPSKEKFNMGILQV